MSFSRPVRVLAFLAVAAAVSGPGSRAETHRIDVKQSSFRISVFKSGFFSAFGHNHEIQAPIAEGTVELSSRPAVSLRVASAELRVLDPEASPSTRADVQKTMLGTQVLDAQRFPQISFRSTSVDSAGNNHWQVHGDLSLHGQTKPLVLQVALVDGHYRGSLTLKQRDFGITPVSVAGGTVKVKNEVKIEFDIVLQP